MIKRLETHFFISVLLMIISGFNVSALLIEHRFAPNFSAKKADFINKIFGDEKAKELYAEFILCLKSKKQGSCAAKVEADLNRINDGVIRNALKQLIALDRGRKGGNTFPSLTLSTIGFAIACLYCAFIILSLRRNCKSS